MFENFEKWFKTTEAYMTITQGSDVKPFCKDAWIAATKESMDEIKILTDEKWRELSRAADKYKALEKKYQEALEVLEFYGDTENWLEEVNRNNLYTVVKNDASDDYNDVLRFGGMRARAFLRRKDEF